MEKKDIADLFELLELYFSGHPKLKVKGIQSAWLAVLEPYSREDVKAALLSYLRERPGFPTPQEIALRCPPIQEEEPQEVFPRNGPMDRRAKEEQMRLYARWKAEQDRLAPLRRAAGLPGTAIEAQNAGMPYTEWQAALEAGGLSTPDRVLGKEAVADERA